MSVVIRPATWGDEVEAQAVMNDAKNLVWLGGFTMLEELKSRVRKQEESGEPTLVIVEVDGEVRATCEAGQKGPVFKMGLVAVNKDFRDFDPVDPAEKRQGFGTGLYTAHAFRAALEGRAVLLDQTHWLNKVMEEFLRSNNFDGPVVEMRQRARNFCSLRFWEYNLAEQGLEPWIKKAEAMREKGWKLEIATPDAYTKTFEDLVKKMSKSGHQDRVEQLHKNRELALETVLGWSV